MKKIALLQYKQSLVRIMFVLLPMACFSQTTYLPQGAKEHIILERLEIKMATDTVFNFSKTKPFSRKQYIPHLSEFDTANLSRADRYNVYTALASNLEWVPEDLSIFERKPIFNTFYRTPANLYEVHTDNFFMALNPVFQYTVGKEQDYDQHLFQNTRGLTVRGRIANKVGFSAYVTDNQERDPSYVQQFENERRAVPGAGFYKDFKVNGYDYFDARGYTTFGVANVIDIAFGYDKNFIGNGHRSLFISDFSAPSLFLKLNTRIWRFNYQNLFMELNSASRLNADQLLPKKYAAMHHLDLAVTKWLNVGLFEGVIFGRKDHFEFTYLNPLIFYRSIEQQNGSFDNAVAGADFKANVAKRFQVYGQFLLDEFNLTETRKGSGWWGNKWGWQAGVKYIDAFTIPNLDLQFESNRVRPFTYSHRDSIANYTHYNQPLAHPLGANFQEFIGILRYQPLPRFMFEAKAIYYQQGRDTGITSNGGNIFLPNVKPIRAEDFGYTIGGGVKTKTAIASILLSYELRPNLFIEANGLIRKQSKTVLTSKDVALASLGIRWNIWRRQFDF